MNGPIPSPAIEAPVWKEKLKEKKNDERNNPRDFGPVH
jgi:hypothetical protein